MKQQQNTLSFAPRGRGMFDITREVRQWVTETGIRTGLLNLFIQHTSCSLLIQENADPDVQADLERFLTRLIPDGDPMLSHVLEGPDDMPAHIRTALTQTSITVPVGDGRLGLGVWQGIYLYEHRLHPATRRILLHLIGE